MNSVAFGRLAAGFYMIAMNTCQYCRFAFTGISLKNVICLKKVSDYPMDYPPFDFLSKECAVLVDNSCNSYAPRFFHQLPLPVEKFFLIEDIQDVNDVEVVQLDLFENAFK